ncbi:serine O-acetyltransferase [Microbacterium gawkjiense]|uniref:serine O-acetyltransferase n=1 Tax=Microbacterium gawkjiense TaxID=3067309 RepID=UPI003BF48D26
MINSRADLATYIAADLATHNVSSWRWRYRFTRRIVYFQWLLRRAEYATNVRRGGLSRCIAKVMQLRVTLLGEKLGFTVPLNTFGPGLSIAHVGTVVVNPDARIGSGCRIHQGVTIGGVAGAAPVLGENVWIGPGAQIFGPIHVGDGAAIGANSVVNRDVPGDVTVAGVPAKVIRGHGYRGADHPAVS